MATYDDIRSQIRTGDIFAFGGKSAFSEIIKTATRSGVSHVGIAMVADIPDDDGGQRVQLLESTIHAGTYGVVLSQLSRVVTLHPGEVWWLPLAAEPRAAIDHDRRGFEAFCLGQVGKPYDMSQAIGSALDLLDGLGAGNTEDFARFFCSELAAAALEHAGAFGAGISVNCSEVTPIDLCMFRLYERCVQLKGDGTLASIKGFNSIAVFDGWGD